MANDLEYRMRIIVDNKDLLEDELKVLELAALGYSQRETADMLFADTAAGISRVKHLRNCVFKKLGTKNSMAQAVYVACSKGMLSPGKEKPIVRGAERSRVMKLLQQTMDELRTNGDLANGRVVNSAR